MSTSQRGLDDDEDGAQSDLDVDDVIDLQAMDQAIDDDEDDDDEESGPRRRDQQAPSDIEWLALILDEGHRVKNANSNFWQMVRSIACEMVWVITATPILNHIRDIRAICHLIFLVSGLPVDRNLISGSNNATPRKGIREDMETGAMPALNKTLRWLRKIDVNKIPSQYKQRKIRLYKAKPTPF
ncbi:hypothetical protein B0T24DRAFT_591045 [Lasiosphaeria ovina]|uniref:SNF2 N-terminal domain-containing protein n=1 Tax=Lasiosphaeria ovina TaxID=92902 RepID=A0AAE0NFM0_9PEZI|nr:hypothetical protein B0T24DRAFT_591045 [Lasiosphaeria ovina]